MYGVNVQLDISYRAVPLNPDQLLLRGAQLRNTQWIYGELNIACTA
jgi:phospholipid-transporting ATPase